jgi:hypothetical protein
MTKLQITITNQEADLLSAKATLFGYKLTRFVKFLIAREVAQTMEQIPTFPISKKAEKLAIEAKTEYKKGKAKEISSFNDL